MKVEQRAGTVTISTAELLGTAQDAERARILIADTKDGRVRIKVLRGKAVARGVTSRDVAIELGDEIWVQ